MRIGAVIFWVVVAAVLGVIAVQTRPTGNAGDGVDAEGVVTLGIDLASVHELRAGTDGRAVTIARTPGGDGSWIVSWGEPRSVWAADEELTRAGLRILASAELATRADGDLVDADSTFAWADGTGSTTMRWGGQALGGRVAAEIDRDGVNRAVWLDVRLANALTAESLMRWRSAVLLTPGTPIQSLWIELTDRGVSLERVAGRWELAGAPELPVDRERIEGAVRAAIELRAMVFAYERSEAFTGTPVATVRTRGVDGSERELAVLGAADAAGKRVRAVARGSAGGRSLGPVWVEVAAGPLDALSPEPWAYLRGTPIDGDRVDVASVEIRSTGAQTPAVRVTRAIDGWRMEGGSEEVGVGIGLDRPAALLDLLTTRRAGSVRAPAGEETVGVFRVSDAALPAPIDVELVRIGDGYGLLLRSAALDVVYEYPDAQPQATLVWAASVLGED